MPQRVTNKHMRDCVDAKREFRNGNETVYARWLNDNLYVVFSYGTHFPMFAFDVDGGWFGNLSRYSRTTSKHQSQTRPSAPDITHMNNDDMIEMIEAGGYVQHCANRVRGETERERVNRVMDAAVEASLSEYGKTLKGLLRGT